MLVSLGQGVRRQKGEYRKEFPEGRRLMFRDQEKRTRSSGGRDRRRLSVATFLTVLTLLETAASFSIKMVTSKKNETRMETEKHSDNKTET